MKFKINVCVQIIFEYEYFPCIMYVCILCACLVHQKRASDPLELDLQMVSCKNKVPHWCWELNLGFLEEQPALTTEPSFQHLSKCFFLSLMT